MENAIRLLDILCMALAYLYTFVMYQVIASILPTRKNWVVKLLTFLALKQLAGTIIF